MKTPEIICVALSSVAAIFFICMVMFTCFASSERSNIHNIKKKWKRWCDKLHRIVVSINRSKNISDLTREVKKLSDIINPYNGAYLTASGSRIGGFTTELNEKCKTCEKRDGCQKHENHDECELELLKSDIADCISEQLSDCYEHSKREIRCCAQIKKRLWIVLAVFSLLLFSTSCYFLNSYLCQIQENATTSVCIFGNILSCSIIFWPHLVIVACVISVCMLMKNEDI